MKAAFKSQINVIRAAADRAGLDRIAGAEFDRKSPCGNQVYIEDSYAGRIDAYGTANSVMRLIGALADDGQECLLEVK